MRKAILYVPDETSFQLNTTCGSLINARWCRITQQILLELLTHKVIRYNKNGETVRVGIVCQPPRNSIVLSFPYLSGLGSSYLSITCRPPCCSCCYCCCFISTCLDTILRIIPIQWVWSRAQKPMHTLYSNLKNFH